MSLWPCVVNNHVQWAPLAYLVAARAVGTGGAGARGASAVRACAAADSAVARQTLIGRASCVVGAGQATRPEQGGRHWHERPRRTGRHGALAHEGRLRLRGGRWGES